MTQAEKTMLLIWKKYKFISFVFLVTLIYIITSIYFNTVTNGYKENISDYFLYPALIVPIIILTISRPSFEESVFYTMIFIVVLATSSVLFWGYMDKPWFSPPETMTCDGPCYGWFSFENESPVIYIVLLGLFSSIVGTLLFIVRSTAVWAWRKYLKNQGDKFKKTLR